MFGSAFPFTLPDFKDATYPGILKRPCDNEPSLSAVETVVAIAFAFSLLQPNLLNTLNAKSYICSMVSVSVSIVFIVIILSSQQQPMLQFLLLYLV